MESLDLDAVVDEFLLDHEAGPAQRGSSATRRVYDPELLKRAGAASAAFQKIQEAALRQFEQQYPELCRGLVGKPSSAFSPKATQGQWRVLLSLIQVILGPKGGERTQDECRQAVAAMYPQFPVTKNWTKPLPKWAISHAKKTVACSAHPVSAISIRNTASLKELHTAVKLATSSGEESALTFKPVVSVTSDYATINGQSFKLTVNKSNGREYPILRVSMPAFLDALHKKPKLT